MEVIIIGCGKVGVTLADQLVREDHNVVMVDTSAERLQVFRKILTLLNWLETAPASAPNWKPGFRLRHSDSSDRFR